MPKSNLHMALEEGHTNFLVSGIRNNNIKYITEWVEDNLIKDNPNTDAKSKISFYEAEKFLLSEYIDSGLDKKFDKLLSAIDNEKFDQEFKDHPNYPKLKANECRVLAGAIIESKRFLEEDNSMHNKLGELLHTKYQTLKTIGYDVSQIKTIDTALQIVHYEESTVSILGAGTSDTAISD